jgi:hypothetical protein
MLPPNKSLQPTVNNLRVGRMIASLLHHLHRCADLHHLRETSGISIRHRATVGRIQFTYGTSSLRNSPVFIAATLD